MPGTSVNMSFACSLAALSGGHGPQLSSVISLGLYEALVI